MTVSSSAASSGAAEDGGSGARRLSHPLSTCGMGQIERRRCWADAAAALGKAVHSSSSSSVATRARPEQQLGSQI
uniref:Uncharacterized protein n=1 Tax=Oryza meridionalis TaxID=40149 RepID=A0A0E0D5Z5_9ORYZ